MKKKSKPHSGNQASVGDTVMIRDTDTNLVFRVNISQISREGWHGPYTTDKGSRRYGVGFFPFRCSEIVSDKKSKPKNPGGYIGEAMSNRKPPKKKPVSRTWVEYVEKNFPKSKYRPIGFPDPCDKFCRRVKITYTDYPERRAKK